jgi:thiamine-monophosphate kinase
MKVEELGEFGLIARLASRVAQRAPQGRGPTSLLLGIGDDAAAWATDGSVELCTTDTMVQGVHFTLEHAAWADVGWKALAVNLSDIAAMGGAPLYAVVTLGLPPDTPVEDVEALYDGMLECGAAHGGTIVGGDVVRSPVAFITVAMMGTTPGPLLTRSAARPGQQVAVTGALGASGAWLAALRQKTHLDPGVAATLRRAHLRPEPRIEAGQRLRLAGVRCAIDISDGLVADLRQVCRASGAAARLDAENIPIHPAARRSFPHQCLDLALSGGEEYELLFTAPPDTIHALQRQLPNGATVVGEILDGPAGQITVVGPDGELDLKSGGWDHFRP